MNSNLKSALAISAVAGLLAGCAAPGAGGGGIMASIEAKAAQNRAATLAQVADRPLVDAFYQLQDGRSALVPPLKQAGFDYVELGRDFLTFRRMSPNQGNMADAAGYMNRWNADSASDAPAQLYVAAAKARGNTVKAYKIPMTVTLHRMLNHPMVMGGEARAWLDRDVSLIEWNPQGRMVSVMTRGHHARAALGVSIQHMTTVFFGPDLMRSLENNLKNSTFQETELRTM